MKLDEIGEDRLIEQLVQGLADRGADVVAGSWRRLRGRGRAGRTV